MARDANGECRGVSGGHECPDWSRESRSPQHWRRGRVSWERENIQDSNRCCEVQVTQ